MSSLRTYASRNRKSFVSSSPQSTLSSSPTAPPPVSRPSKRPLSDLTSPQNTTPLFPPSKRLKRLPKLTDKLKPKATSKPKNAQSSQKTLTQLHFTIDQAILRTCSLCDLSFTKGAPDDEALHRAHCARVRQGMEWGREEEKDRIRNGEPVVVEIKTDIKLKGGKKKGRIICFPADIGGKLGAKLTTLLQTINLSLSAPDLPPSALQSSKAYLFLIPHETQSHRERIVGCVIAQRITTAMAIVASSTAQAKLPSDDNSDQTSTSHSEAAPSIIVDTTTNLCCSPTPLPTPMGISRLFVSSSHRRLGIACAMLDAAAATFIYGCPVDPKKGQVAFSQPTGMGQGVMKSWGSARVFEE